MAKKIGSILTWLFGFIFLFVGLVSLSTALLSGLIFLGMGLILFPLSSSFLSSKGINISRNLKIAIIVFGVLIGGALAPQSAKPKEIVKTVPTAIQPTKTVVSNVKKVVAKPTVKPPTPTTKVKSVETKLWEAVDKSLHTRKDVTIDYSKDDESVIMTFYRDNYLDENHIVKDAYTAFVNFGIEAFKIPGIRDVNVQSKVEMMNQYGKKERDSVVIVQMNKTTFQKFEWDNLRNSPSANIYGIFENNAEIHSIVPGIMKNVDTDKLWIK